MIKRGHHFTGITGESYTDRLKRLFERKRQQAQWRCIDLMFRDAYIKSLEHKLKVHDFIFRKSM